MKWKHGLNNGAFGVGRTRGLPHTTRLLHQLSYEGDMPSPPGLSRQSILLAKRSCREGDGCPGQARSGPGMTINHCKAWSKRCDNWCPQHGIEPGTSRLQDGCSRQLELCGRAS